MGAINPNKRNIIISKVKKHHWRKAHKYGLRIPKNVTEAMYIDQKNGNNYGKGAIDKETNKANIAYKPREDRTLEEVRKWKVDDMHGY